MNNTDLFNMISNTERFRDRLVLILLGNGIRVADIKKLKPRNILNNRIIIKGKVGRKTKEFFVPIVLIDILNAFIKQEKIGKNEYLFQVSHYILRNIVKNAGHSIGKDVNAQLLRRLAIENILNFRPNAHLDRMISRHTSLVEKYKNDGVNIPPFR